MWFVHDFCLGVVYEPRGESFLHEASECIAAPLLDRVLVHQGVTPAVFCSPGWQHIIWGKGSCVKRQWVWMVGWLFEKEADVVGCHMLSSISSLFMLL